MYTNAAIGDFFKSLRKYFLKLWLGFEPQCFETYLSGSTKWGKILLALPAWVFWVALVLLRTFVLSVLFFSYIFIVSMDFFTDISRDIRKWYWDQYVWPIATIAGTTANFFYTMLAWPWLVAAGLFEFSIQFQLEFWAWAITGIIDAQQVLWDVFWLVNDTIWYYVVKPVIDFFIFIILWFPRLLLSIYHFITLWYIKPFDDFCLVFVMYQDQIADWFLTFISFPTWETSLIEFPLALPILLAEAWFES